MRNKYKNRIFRFNRRIKNLTDYRQRLRLLKSGLVRVVIRKFNNNFLVQFVEYKEDGDKIIASAYAKDLEKFNLKIHKGNLATAYLTGYLAAKRFMKKGYRVDEDLIVDFGLQKVIFGNKLFAALKGVLDTGLKVKVGENENLFPKEERLLGKHTKLKDEAEKNVKEVKLAIDKKFK